MVPECGIPRKGKAAASHLHLVVCARVNRTYTTPVAMLVDYDDSDDSDEEPQVFSMPAIAQHDFSDHSDDELAAPVAAGQEHTPPPNEHAADCSSSALPSADDFDALGSDAGAFLMTAVVAEPAASQVSRAVPLLAEASESADPSARNQKVQGPRARPIWSFAEAKYGGKRKADSERKAESEQNAKKHAGKVKGEFKKKSETSRGGEHAPVRWD